VPITLKPNLKHLKLTPAEKKLASKLPLDEMLQAYETRFRKVFEEKMAKEKIAKEKMAEEKKAKGKMAKEEVAKEEWPARLADHPPKSHYEVLKASEEMLAKEEMPTEERKAYYKALKTAKEKLAKDTRPADPQYYEDLYQHFESTRPKIKSTLEKLTGVFAGAWEGVLNKTLTNSEDKWEAAGKTLQASPYTKISFALRGKDTQLNLPQLDGGYSAGGVCAGWEGDFEDHLPENINKLRSRVGTIFSKTRENAQNVFQAMYMGLKVKDGMPTVGARWLQNTPFTGNISLTNYMNHISQTEKYLYPSTLLALANSRAE
jgi:hypothetical protein